MSDVAEISEFTVPVAGGELAVFSLGRADAAAPPVIAVHGITATSRAWIPVARSLGARARVVAVDLRGRGASRSLPQPYGIGAHAADLLAVIDHLALQRAVLVGHSLGAYIVARVAADHPQRVEAAVLVDGGLAIPGSEGADPQAFADAFLGPALARLQMTFPSHEAYYEWWRRHPALAQGEVTEQDLTAYADHDLVGVQPELRPSAVEQAVRADAGELAEFGKPARLLKVKAALLCAPRGLLDDPNPMQPLPLVQAWAAEDPHRREAIQVADVNHYTITLTGAGAAAVANAIAARLPAQGS